MPKTKTRKVKDAIKTRTPHKITQFDESSAAGARYYDAEEEQRIIDSKYQSRIQMQVELRKLHLTGTYQYAEIEELQKIHENYETAKVIPQWYGIPMPKNILVNELHIKIHDFKQVMTRREYLRNGLKKLGFDDELVQKVMWNAEYVKDYKKLKKMEETYLDSKK